MPMPRNYTKKQRKQYMNRFKSDRCTVNAETVFLGAFIALGLILILGVIV